MASTRSPSGALLVGQAPPRVRHAPSVRANSWEDVADLSASLGVTLDEWQEAALEAAMGERADGRWAARLVGVSAPRQQGKSQLIVARALAGVLLFDEQTILVSAHQTDTAREVFQRLLDIIDDNPSVARRVDSVMKAINRESIRFKGGQTIKIKARSLAGGRGFSADCLLLDEAQILGESAWSSILPTMSARENPQAWLLGTPPTPQDDGEVFGRLREAGLKGTDARTAWLEWSADEHDDFDDPATWAKANPAYGTRISREAIESERAAMSDTQFAMERLGMWSGASSRAVIPAQMWADAADSQSLAIDRFALGLEVAPDAERASVALAGQRDDGTWHVELDEAREGVAWVVPYVKALLEANPQIRGVAVDAGSPSKVLLDEFKSAGVHVITPKVVDLGSACTSLLAGVVANEVWHIDQGQMNTAVSVAGKRALGDTGMWVWSRKSAAADITPVQAGTLALWVAQLEDIWKAPLRAASDDGSVTVL